MIRAGCIVKNKDLTPELHDTTKFQALLALLLKIEKWWFINFEAAINPEMFPKDSDPNDVIPGVILTFQLMLDIALGNEPEGEGYYYNVVNKLKA